MMMAEAPWTSVPVEQAHGSCAVLHRAHPMYGSAMISTRAMLHQARRFFVQDPGGRAAERRASKLVRLEKKQPQKIIGRNVFLRDLMQEARSGLRQDERLSAASRQRVVRLHGALHKALPLEVQVGYDSAARAEIAQRSADVASEAQHVRADLALKRKRDVEERLSEGLTHKGSLMRVTDEAMQRMAEVYDSGEYSTKVVAELRAKALQPPGVPPTSVMNCLEDCPVLAAPLPAREIPPWPRSMCYTSNHFRDCALLTETVDGGSCVLVPFRHAEPAPSHLPLRDLQHASAACRHPEPHGR
jgi:hypothetical protein